MGPAHTDKDIHIYFFFHIYQRLLWFTLHNFAFKIRYKFVEVLIFVKIRATVLPTSISYNSLERYLYRTSARFDKLK